MNALDPSEWALKMAQALFGASHDHRAAANLAMSQWSDFVGLFFNAGDAPPKRCVGGCFESLRSTDSALTRKATLYRPDSAPQGAPLVVMLHGCMQSADAFARLTGMSELAEANGFCVLYPDQDTGSNIMQCWNWHDASNQKREGGEPEALAELIRKASAITGSPPEKTHLAGISAGGALASLMAHLYPELLESCAIVAGPMPFSAQGTRSALKSMRKGPGGADRGADGRNPVSPRKRLPMLIIHGQDDDVVHPKHGVSQVMGALILNEKLEAVDGLGHAPAREQRAFAPQGDVRVWRDEEGELVAVLVSPKDLRHAWSGGKPSECFSQSGFSASQLAVSFFEAAERGDDHAFDPDRLCAKLWGPAFKATIERKARGLIAISRKTPEGPASSGFALASWRERAESAAACDSAKKPVR